MERQANVWEMVSVTHIINWKIHNIYRIHTEYIYEEFLPMNRKKTCNPNFQKWENDYNRQSTQEDSQIAI